MAIEDELFEAQEKKNAAYIRSKDLWKNFGTYCIQVANDPFKINKEESIELVEDFIKRIRLMNEWAK